MSTFPPFAKCHRIEANSPEQKPHRFDKFARKIGANMLEAIRVTLAVFSSPDKERWPAVRLLEFLKGAEALARDMLRELAGQIFISLAPQRVAVVRSVVARPEPGARTPYFRLGVKSESEQANKETCHPGREAIRDPGTQVRAQEQLGPGSAPFGLGRDDNDESESLFARRLIAINDVLAHPGKHAARMARALYRQSHNVSASRLIAKSPDDVLLDKVDLALAAHLRGDGNAVARLHDEVMKLEPG